MINCQWSDELGQHPERRGKKYIADSQHQLYTINAIDKAIEIGIMASAPTPFCSLAFFKLADVMPHPRMPSASPNRPLRKATAKRRPGRR